MLTKRQKKFYEELKEIVKDKGYFPTVREIGKKFGLSSPATVQAHLNRLCEQGYLTRQGRLWEFGSNFVTVPIMGIVPAGNPVEIFESLGEEIELPKWMVEKGGNIMGFKVKGESMKDAYIQENDVVVVKRTSKADAGEMVIAYLKTDNSITLKRLKKEGEKYYLVPENPEFEPIYDPFELVGKVIGVLRKYR
ncbi:MAG: transcriptional repressor LexA [Acidobacteria bacterium]|jgi:repressor LexA|nr:transcriptional repressor LexA [Acidobacteriota bacterium]